MKKVKTTTELKQWERVKTAEELTQQES